MSDAATNAMESMIPDSAKQPVDPWTSVEKNKLRCEAQAKLLESQGLPQIADGWWILCDMFHASELTIRAAEADGLDRYEAVRFLEQVSNELHNKRRAA